MTVCLVLIFLLYLGTVLVKDNPSGYTWPEGETVTVTGKVYQKEQTVKQGSEQTVLYLELFSMEGKDGQMQALQTQDQNVICYLKTNQEIPEIGSIVRATGKVKCFQKASNPGQFDAESYYRILQISFQLNQTEIQAKSNSYSKLKETLFLFRQRCAQILDETLPEKESSIMKTMLLGEKRAVDKEIKALYQRNGIVHILAISGLHISLIGMTLYELLKKLGMPLPVRTGLTFAVMVLYIIMTGFSVSAIRALIMFGFHMLAQFVKRTYDLLTAASVSAVLILLEQPLYLYHSGFLFSFGCIYAIGLVVPAMTKVKKKTSKEGEIPEKQPEGGLLRFLSGLALTLACLPLQLWFYYQVPVYAVILNLFVIPLMSFLVPGGLVLLLAGGMSRTEAAGASGVVAGAGALQSAGVVGASRAVAGVGALQSGGIVGVSGASGVVAGAGVLQSVGVAGASGTVAGAGALQSVGAVGASGAVAGSGALQSAGVVGASGAVAGAGALQSTGVVGASGAVAGARALQCVGAVGASGTVAGAGALQSAGVVGASGTVAGAGTLQNVGAPEMVAGFLKEVSSMLITGVLFIYESGCLLLEKLPGNLLITGRPEGWQVILYLLVLLFLVLFRNRISLVKKWIILFCGVGILVLSFPENMKVTFLDVGQGDCIHIQSEAGVHYLVDGGSSDVSDVGEYRIIPYLKYQGISTLEAVFITHPDEDHCNGLMELFRQGKDVGILVKKVYLPDIAESSKSESFDEIVEIAENAGIEVNYLSKGQILSEGELRFSCMHPEKGYECNEENEYSLVLEVTYDDFSMLLTGDVEGGGEELLTEYLKEHAVEDKAKDKNKNQDKLMVLKVAHHGSKNSTSEELLEILQPAFAVISCGKNNSYGHPHEETIERLEDVGSRIVITAESGAIMFEIDEELKIRGYSGEW